MKIDNHGDELMRTDIEDLVGHVNWVDLRAQKLLLLITLDTRKRDTPTDEVASLEGLLNLVDAIQDAAAAQAGKEIIFGKTFREPEGDDFTGNRWAITLRKDTEWSTYVAELDRVADRESVMNFKIPPHPPKDLKEGDRCYVIWRGRVRGWMEVAGVQIHPEGFTCSTTGVYWSPGAYLQRTGGWHMIMDGPLLKGFQGIHRYTQAITEDD